MTTGTPTEERCSGCEGRLVVWPYLAAEGDLLFSAGYDVLEGSGELQKRAALLCAKCDRLDLMPRRNRP